MKAFLAGAAAIAALSCGSALAQSPKQPKIEVLKLAYHLSGSVMLIDELTLSSFSDRPVKDIVLRCTTTGRSETKLTEVTITLYDYIEPKGVQYFYKVNLGLVHPQSAYMDCEVIKAVRL